MSRGVLFDVDGTLVDTTYLHTVCWSEALRQSGHVLPMAAVHRSVGMGSGQLLDRLLGPDRDHSNDSMAIAAHLALYKQFWTRLNALPGASDLLRACSVRGLRVVLASSASEEELAALRAVIDAADTIDVATSSSDADAAKPAPDLLHAALEQSGLRAADAVFVGDSVWDGEAARRADVAFVGVSCGGTSSAELAEAGAVEVWPDPADLLAHLDQSIIGAG